MDTLSIPLSLCIYDDVSITVYPVETGHNPTQTYKDLKNAYIVGIRNSKRKILAAGVILSSIDNTCEQLAEAAAGIFAAHKVTAHLLTDAVSLPASKLQLHLDKGSIEEALSESELNMLYADFYVNHSVAGNA
ncbi:MULTISPECIES: negative control protein of sporulation [Erwinia]|uniref:Negative control protein of sporulation n=1 Tax=Erwinia pyrifoliae TaxID=79967 RepID=A0ABY5X6Q7_ERWPY|nr:MULTISPECIES: negative control protein of sporulation [Erwinia]UWS33070.1 negative control protein of sporulation [Erwinia pyrifoliae]